MFTATVRKINPVQNENLIEFGRYVAECMPKYVQKVQLVTGDELEVLIAPEGVVPVLQFLKDHHQCQFASLADMGAMDVPSRENRFEARELTSNISKICLQNFLFIYSSFIICCPCVTMPVSVLKPTLMN